MPFPGLINLFHRATVAEVAIATVVAFALTSAASAQVYRAEIPTTPAVLRVDAGPRDHRPGQL